MVLPSQLHIAQSFLSVASDIHPLCSFHFLTPFPDAFSVLLGVYLFFLLSATILHFFLGVFSHFSTGDDSLLRSEPEAKRYFDTLTDYAREQIQTRSGGVNSFDSLREHFAWRRLTGKAEAFPTKELLPLYTFMNLRSFFCPDEAPVRSYSWHRPKPDTHTRARPRMAVPPIMGT